MRLLGNDLDHVELELDGGLAAEHRNDNVDRIVVDLDALDSAGEAGQGTVEDPDRIAHCVVDDDFLLLNTHGVDFIFRQRDGIVAGCAHEASDTADRFDDMPGVIAVHHLDQNVAGEHLTVVSLADAFGRAHEGPFNVIDYNWPDSRWFTDNIRNTFWLVQQDTDTPLDNHDELLNQ